MMSTDPQVDSSNNTNDMAMNLLICWSRRWIPIAIFVLVVTVSVGLFAIFMKKTYTAYAVVIVKGQKNSGNALLSSLGAGDMASLLGNAGNPTIKTIYTLSESRILAKRMISKYRLDTVWEFKSDWKFEDGLRRWNRSLMISEGEMNSEAINIAYSDDDPARSAKIVDDVVAWLDSSYLALEMSHSKRNLEFINERIESKNRQIDSAESALVGFMKKEKLLAPGGRIELSSRRIAEMEAQLEVLGIQAEMAKKIYGPESSERAMLKDQSALLEANLVNMEQGDRKSWVAASVGKDIDKSFVFERMRKVLDKHVAVVKYLVQQQEMLQIDSRRNISAITIADPVRVPEKKSAPKVFLMVQLAFAMSMVFSLTLVALESHIRRALGIVFGEIFRNRR
jgi:uncharacterized protein involved in exopolysaccharide biosynthesis